MRPKPFQGIDYFSREDDRRRLTEFLRNGNFKKIAGAKELDGNLKRMRIVFCCVVSLFLLTGLFFILF